MTDALFIGGGAAGLCGALMLKRRAPQTSVMVLEKAPRVGKKLLATGNGTCNLSNIHADVSHYHGQDTSFVSFALDTFSPEDARAFFGSIGVKTEVRPNGRIYPECASAAAVLDCLRLALDEAGVEVVCDTAVTEIAPKNGEWEVKTLDKDGKAKMLYTKNVVLAAGGCASPKLGGCGDGYDLLAPLGYERTALTPSIVTIKTDTTFVKAVKGLRVDAAVSLSNGKQTRRDTGEVLFCDYGLSGPAVMQVSRLAGEWERKKQGDLLLSLDLCPDVSEAELFENLKTRRAELSDRLLEDFLTGLFQRRVGQTAMKAAKVLPFTRKSATLADDELKTLAKTLKKWEFSVVGTTGFANAQVTAGGLKTDAFDPTTMQSKRHRGLYALGEVLDVDGDCGGFNLHFAWGSAFVCAAAIAKEAAE